MAKSFSDIYGEVYKRKFGKPAQLEPARSENLAQELAKATADEQPPPAPPATAVQAADDDGSDERSVTCPECGHTFVADHLTSPTTRETGEHDEANEGDAARIPDWSNSLKSRRRAMVQRKICGAIPPADTND